MEWMFLPLKRYAQFSGRSRRREYWMWVLFIVIATIVLSLLDSALGLGGRTTAESTSGPGSFSYNAGIRGGVLTGIFLLATFIPSLAVQVRRLHDRDRSGWWILLPLLPLFVAGTIMVTALVSLNLALMLVAWAVSLLGFACGILLLVWYCLPGTSGPNRYGDDPLGNTAEDLAKAFE